MKKLFFAAAFLAMAVAANAQWIIGGQFGLQTSGGKVDVEKTTLQNAYDYPLDKTCNFGLAPTISYVLNEKMQVGAGITFGRYSETEINNNYVYADGKEDYTKTVRSSFGIAPYFRYYFAQFGTLNFFCEAALSLSVTPRYKAHDYDNTGNPVVDNEYEGIYKYSTVALTVVPGFNYKFGGHWSADCYIDLAGLALTHNTHKRYGTNLNNEDVLLSTTKNNQFGLIANMTAQPLLGVGNGLTGHFTNFRIGFNYHF